MDFGEFRSKTLRPRCARAFPSSNRHERLGLDELWELGFRCRGFSTPRSISTSLMLVSIRLGLLGHHFFGNWSGLMTSILAPFFNSSADGTLIISLVTGWGTA